VNARAQHDVHETVTLAEDRKFPALAGLHTSVGTYSDVSSFGDCWNPVIIKLTFSAESCEVRNLYAAATELS